MASKGAKETLVSKLGFRSNNSGSKAEAELEKVRKENAHLRKKIDEQAKRHVKPPDSDKSKLLERILSLETLRERNNQQLLVKEQELESLRQQLSAKGGEVVASLQAQLEQRRREAEQRDGMFQNLSQETENLKNKLATVSARCQSLETQATNGHAPAAELVQMQDQLKDALEKNQQWLVYDQQREVFVQSVVARTMELEQQLAQAKQQQESKAEPSSEVSASNNTQGKEKESDLKKHYETMLLGVQKDLESQKDQTARALQELSVQKEQTLKAQAELQRQREQVGRVQQERCVLQRKYDDKCSELLAFLRKYEERGKELDEAKIQLQAERLGNRQVAHEERKVSSERTDRVRADLEKVEKRLDEEKKRSADLLQQVNMLQKSLINQNEERRRIAALEQQIQLSAKDSENEKLDRQSMQEQLQKVLKELRKARDQIAKLESAKQQSARFSEPSSHNNLEFERLTINSHGPTSPSKVISLLDESFLECPKCQAPYPTSRHRELLAHIDYCFA
ncbi:centrosomal protein of 55 kDa [Poeciliopsis prolifica]|uniref:centrosomal protein of 55 kDa n=1 Tax=Poeciliopsis prolifica TaxID=188132 RepID=UPI00241438D9|nr:centrosomal protein of 55 kDa [Poeciliopsis prolifica]XP_054878582.1 centrosomal protein of 55 kDa [Poeciliopsis prolifica]